MNVKYIFFLFLIFQSISLTAQKEVERDLDYKRKALKNHDKAFVTMGDKIRDPFILEGPDGNYYLTGTTAGSYWGDTVGVKIYKSSDLCEWESLGFVWTLEGAGKDCWYYSRPPSVSSKKQINPYAVWAPEVHYYNNTWWLTVSRNGGGNGLLKSTSGDINGPYEEVFHYDKGIDSHLFSDGETVYYSYGYKHIAAMTPNMDAIADEEYSVLQLPGKHAMGYEGILMMKFDDKFLWIASGRYGYEPTNTYDLYYSVSKSLTGNYLPRRMAVKNAGHGNFIRDKKGQWWCTAFDHEFTKQWSCWLVPVDFHVKENDVEIEVLDERFRPTEEDQDFVRKLAAEGFPEEWEGKTWWWRNDGK